MNADYGGGHHRTWDGLPVVDRPPFGTTVVVYQHGAAAIEVLLLHRRAAGPPGFEGDWAWTPPSGARQPGETVEGCARRELLEETGLDLVCTCLDASGDWALFAAEAPPNATIRIDEEHDEAAWVTVDEAVRRCRPEVVADHVRKVRKLLSRSEASK